MIWKKNFDWNEKFQYLRKKWEIILTDTLAENIFKYLLYKKHILNFEKKLHFFTSSPSSWCVCVCGGGRGVAFVLNINLLSVVIVCYCLLIYVYVLLFHSLFLFHDFLYFHLKQIIQHYYTFI